MSKETDTQTLDPRESVANGGDATEAEAELIKAGTDVDEEGNPIDAEAATQATADAEAAAAAEATAKAEADAKAASDAETAQQQEQQAAAAQAPAQQPVALPPKPEPPKDFAAERTTLKQKYDAGDFDQDEYLEQREKLTLEEAAFTGRLAAWETNVETIKATAAATSEAHFNAVALAWEQKHADFIANPLRQSAMQEAIQKIDDGKMPPEELFEKAAKIAFEAFNYTPPAASTEPAKTPEQIKADALKKRKPDTSDVPNTLATAPQAASLDANSANYSKMDDLHIDDLEGALARMTPEQQRAYLDGAPGGPGQQQFD